MTITEFIIAKTFRFIAPVVGKWHDLVLDMLLRDVMCIHAVPSGTHCKHCYTRMEFELESEFETPSRSIQEFLDQLGGQQQ